jgi:hypothetical protein
MLRAGAMARRAAYIVLGCLLGAFLLPREARAQMIAAPSSVYQPTRSTSLRPVSMRPDNLNPYAVNYDDCDAGLQLTFDLLVQGFTGSAASDTVQVWASRGDRGCWQDSTRMKGTAECWPVLPNPVVPKVGNGSITIPAISAWDIIGQSPSPTYQLQTGPTLACTQTQADFNHLEFFLYFLPITNNGLFDTSGAYYQYQLNVDVVGPPAPALQPTGVGDTFLVANWTPNSDAETIGYNVFVDLLPGQGSLGTTGSATSCGDAGTTGAPDASTGDAAASGGSTSGNACNDQNLVGAICPPPSSSVDAGSSADAGDGGEGGAPSGSTSVCGNGGIATFALSKSALNASAGMTVPDKSVSTYNITGLKNCAHYAFVVSAVDGYGNVGPPSRASCAYPQPTGDFWTAYRSSGGEAGGFCALETVGRSPHSLAALALMGGGVAFAASRRRRRAR